ncbi:ArgE/DapE family deacylase [Aerococcus kribbianus]|uniref:Probable succinyl-diaminopimelate desuccinylase n=1 Tax=Aerococcus kribbianus TaxID=2999064 RepID=A0A9X3FP58_9LACT|nr:MULTISPECIES: ArgE/DapE family deacylase [unclassified Aerococcus]MCZ0717383.1 ArgE/DapE family deacylase [Aerococcus sp. YH-aer221]MCZ0725671.1 ArgE/DapE family deacylase [Aerococcus sp. YH-aer222]
MDKEKKVQILQDIIQIKSVNDNEAEVAQYLADVFKEYDIDSEQVEYDTDRNSLVAEFGDGSGSDLVLGISGHLDVVAAGDEDEWKYPPFSGEIEGDKLYGRGTSDMKSGVAALVIALIEFKEDHPDFNGKIRFLGTVGEEVGQYGSEQLAKEGYVDDVTDILIGEPTGEKLIYTHKGSILYTVTSKGKSSHSSMPKEGINAISALAKFVVAADKELGQVTEDYHDEILGETTNAITIISGGDQVNSIPAQAKIEGNARTIPDYDNDKVIETLENIIKDINDEGQGQLELHLDNNKYSVAKPDDSAIMQAAIKVVGSDFAQGGISPTTDAASFTKDHDLNLLIFGPGEAELPHQLDEYVSIDNYLEFIDRYKAIFENYFDLA